MKPAHGRERQRDAGQPLPDAAARWIEAKLGTSVDDVRLHTGPEAAATSAEHEATAVTQGNHIDFAPGAFQPGTATGLLRLLHETTHAVQQRGSSPQDGATADQQETEVDLLLSSGQVPALTLSAPGALREPTYPRRATGNALVVEAERVLTQLPDPASTDPTVRMWSRVSSNFGAITAGTIARRIWTSLFARHLTEAPSRPGVESVHPRYFYSRNYGWVDGQHFFGFIDYAEREMASAGNRETAFEAATEHGFDIERKQQQVRDYVMLQRPPSDDPVIRLMQVRPPNTPAFRAPVAVAGAAMRALAVARGTMLGGPEGELFRQLDASQQDKFLNDSAMSAWTFEDPTSNQLGIRFFFQHGARINALPVGVREGEFRNALLTFFRSIGVVEDQAELDRLAADLPGRERYEAPHTTEERERTAHPDLYRPPTAL